MDKALVEAGDAGRLERAQAFARKGWHPGEILMWAAVPQMMADFATSECVGLRAELDKLERDEMQIAAERDEAEDALQMAHVALGGDGEWSAKIPAEPPPNSGDLKVDVVVLAQNLRAELEAANKVLNAIKRCPQCELTLDESHHCPMCNWPEEGA